MAGAAGLRAGSAALRVIPTSVSARIGSGVGSKLGRRAMRAKAAHLANNLAVATETSDQAALDELAAAAFGSYGRYWAETLKMPYRSATEIDRGFSFFGYDRIADELARGRGALVCLPHLGGWEWAAAWLGKVMGSGVTAVVEALEPAEVFDWFVNLRQSYDVDVVPLGSGAGAAVTKALANNRIVTLLCDRDLAGNGVEVDFFGRPTMVPSGPAFVALRADIPLLPTAVYFRPHDRVCRISEPIYPERRGSLRADVQALTQELIHVVETQILQAPEQWHVLEPIWSAPADLGLIR